jgi:hypothetical protein
MSEQDFSKDEEAAYRAWMFSDENDDDPGEGWEIQERAWLGGYRAHHVPVEPYSGAYEELVMLLHERDRIIAELEAELDRLRAALRIALGGGEHAK